MATSPVARIRKRTPVDTKRVAHLMRKDVLDALQKKAGDEHVPLVGSPRVMDRSTVSVLRIIEDLGDMAVVVVKEREMQRWVKEEDVDVSEIASRAMRSVLRCANTWRGGPIDLSLSVQKALSTPKDRGTEPGAICRALALASKLCVMVREDGDALVALVNAREALAELLILVYWILLCMGQRYFDLEELIQITDSPQGAE